MTDQLRQGRRAPYTTLAEWMLLAKVSVGAKAAYWALRAHLHNQDAGATVYPSQPTLAEILDCSQPSVNRYVKELSDLGAIDKHPPAEAGGHCTYVLHDTPPDGYQGHASLAEFYAARNADRPARPKLTAITGGKATTPAKQARPELSRVVPNRPERPKLTPPPDAPLKAPAAHVPDVEASAEGYALADSIGLPQPTPGNRRLVAVAADRALALGWSADALRRELEGFHLGARWPARVAVTRLERLGPPPAPLPRPEARAADRCTKIGHGWAPADDCHPCRSEAAAAARSSGLTSS